MKIETPVQLTPQTTHVVLEDTPTSKYVVTFGQSENIMLFCGQDARKPVAKKLRSLVSQNKLNCSGVANTIMEFKHYHPKRGKWWTSAPGVDFLFCVPKSQIKLLPVQGCSYVHVEINGVKVTLNVGGGTTWEENTKRSGWQDWVRDESHTLVNMPMKKMKAISEVAIIVPTPDNIMLEPERQKLWDKMVYKQDYQSLIMQAIVEGKRPQVVLAEGFSYHGGKTSGVVDSVMYGKKSKQVPCDEKAKAMGYSFKIECVPTKRVRSILIDSGSSYGRFISVKPTQIDWEKSAALLS